MSDKMFYKLQLDIQDNEVHLNIHRVVQKLLLLKKVPFLSLDVFEYD